MAWTLATANLIAPCQLLRSLWWGLSTEHWERPRLRRWATGAIAACGSLVGEAGARSCEGLAMAVDLGGFRESNLFVREAFAMDMAVEGEEVECSRWRSGRRWSWEPGVLFFLFSNWEGRGTGDCPDLDLGSVLRLVLVYCAYFLTVFWALSESGLLALDDLFLYSLVAVVCDLGSSRAIRLWGKIGEHAELGVGGWSFTLMLQSSICLGSLLLKNRQASCRAHFQVCSDHLLATDLTLNVALQGYPITHWAPRGLWTRALPRTPLSYQGSLTLCYDGITFYPAVSARIVPAQFFSSMVMVLKPTRVENIDYKLAAEIIKG